MFVVKPLLPLQIVYMAMLKMPIITHLFAKGFLKQDFFFNQLLQDDDITIVDTHLALWGIDYFQMM